MRKNVRSAKQIPSLRRACATWSRKSDRSCNVRAGHQPALLHALPASIRAAAAMFLVVFFAFRGAGLTGVGAAAAQVVHELRALTHKCQRNPAQLGAFPVQANAICHGRRVGLADAGIKAAVAFLHALNARRHARLMVLVRHGNLEKEGPNHPNWTAHGETVRAFQYAIGAPSA
jgi:hypothetical protein